MSFALCPPQPFWDCKVLCLTSLPVVVSVAARTDYVQSQLYPPRGQKSFVTVYTLRNRRECIEQWRAGIPKPLSAE